MAGKNKSWIIIPAVLAAAVIFLAIVLAATLYKGRMLNEADEGQASARNDDLNAEETADVTIVRKEKAEETDPYGRTIDFDGLREINPGVCAWIYIPGTGIDCAVVTDAGDPGYYTENGIDGLDGVFMQSYNAADFSDRMSVIYGKRNTEGVSEFEKLFKFQDADFYKENKYIYIYTPGAVKRYRIFAAHRAVANHLMLGYDWAVDDIFMDYINGVLKSREIGDNTDGDVSITAEDKVLTLSERVKDDKDVRFLVQGVLEE